MKFYNKFYYLFFLILLIITISNFFPIINAQSNNVVEDYYIEIAFFYDPDCPCSQKAIPIIQDFEKNNNNLNISWFDVRADNNRFLSKKFFTAYNVPNNHQSDYPFLFLGDFYFRYKDITKDNINMILNKYEGINVPLWPEWNVTWTINIAFFYDSQSDIGKNASSVTKYLNTAHYHTYSYDIFEDQYNYSLLQEFYLVYNASVKSDKAAIFIGDYYFIDEEINFDNIRPILYSYEGKTIPLKNVTIPITKGNVCVLFFYSPTCSECYRANIFLEKMKTQYPNLNIKKYSTAERENEVLKQSYYEYYKVPKNRRGTMAVFIGNRYFTTSEDLEKEFENEIDKYPNGISCPEVEPDENVIIDVFNSFGVNVIILAGLIDGLNPCAFATLIFFITYLTITGKKKKQILFIGFSFSMGVFITYLILGLGFFILIHSLENFSFIALLIYPITAIVAFIFGAYNTIDYFKSKTGKKEEMKLKLPNRIKKLIGKSIRDLSKVKYFFFIAFFTGVIISLLEFMCTGQVYLPTIVYIIGVPEYQAQAFFYLLLYNFMFILPLLIIFISVYFGVGSKKLQIILEKRRPYLKLFTAIMLYLLGIIILLFFIRIFGYI